MPMVDADNIVYRPDQRPVLAALAVAVALHLLVLWWALIRSDSSITNDITSVTHHVTLAAPAIPEPATTPPPPEPKPEPKPEQEAEPPVYDEPVKFVGNENRSQTEAAEHDFGGLESGNDSLSRNGEQQDVVELTEVTETPDDDVEQDAPTQENETLEPITPTPSISSQDDLNPEAKPAAAPIQAVLPNEAETAPATANSEDKGSLPQQQTPQPKQLLGEKGGSSLTALNDTELTDVYVEDETDGILIDASAIYKALSKEIQALTLEVWEQPQVLSKHSGRTLTAVVQLDFDPSLRLHRARIISGSGSIAYDRALLETFKRGQKEFRAKVISFYRSNFQNSQYREVRAKYVNRIQLPISIEIAGR